MIECKKYNYNMKDYSIKIHRGQVNSGIKIKARTKEEKQKAAKKLANKASEADRIIKWLETGSKVGLTSYTDSQLEQIKEKIEKFKHDFERDGIDINNQLEILTYIYIVNYNLKLCTKVH